METLNCDYFQITIFFDEKIFKKAKFKKDSGCDNEDHNAFVSHYVNSTDHAHLEIILDGEDSKIEISLHPGGLEQELQSDEKPFETCLMDVSQYFKRKKQFAGIRTAYKYDPPYESVLKLNYPVLISDELFAGANIIGHTIEFSEDSMFDRAFISMKEKSVLIIVTAFMEINTSTFDPYNEIARLEKPVHALVKRG